jgi:hypothetical protein
VKERSNSGGSSARLAVEGVGDVDADELEEKQKRRTSTLQQNKEHCSY